MQLELLTEDPKIMQMRTDTLEIDILMAVETCLRSRARCDTAGSALILARQALPSSWLPSYQH